MTRTMCKSKVHRATVTESRLDYIGSLTMDTTLMEAADIRAYEQVHVVNVTNGSRFVTYAIESDEPDTGVMCVNGAAARLVAPGDIIIVLAYGQFDEHELERFDPRIVFVDASNRIVKKEMAEQARTVWSTATTV